MSELLFEAKLEQIATGLRLGMHQINKGLWDTASGMLFQRHGMMAAHGYGQLSAANTLFDSGVGDFDDGTGLFDSGIGTNLGLTSTANSPIRGVLGQFSSNKNRRVVYGTKDKIWFYEGGAPIEVGSGFEGNADEALGTVASQWSFASFGNWTIASNGVDPVQIYKSGPAFGALANTPFTFAEVVFKFGPHVVAANTSNGANWVEWAHEDNPEGWDPVTYPTAGNLPLHDLEGPIVAAVPLGQNWAIYTANEVQVMRRVSAALVFGVFPALQGIGAVSKSSVVSVGAANYGLMREGVFITDGATARWVSYPQLGTWLASNINWEQKSKIVGWHSRAAQEVRWSVPLVGSNEPNLTICFNYATNEFNTSLIVVIAACEAGILPYPILGLQDGSVLAGDKDFGLNGASLARYAQTVPLDFGARLRWKFIDYIQVEGEGEFELLVGWQEKPQDTVQWEGPYQINETLEPVFIRQEGVFFTFKFQATGTEAWGLSNFKVMGVAGGGTI